MYAVDAREIEILLHEQINFQLPKKIVRVDAQARDFEREPPNINVDEL
jgi:hypothetical protein